MTLITENDVRAEYQKNCDMKVFNIGKDAIITPAAREYLLDKKVSLVVDGKSDGRQLAPSVSGAAGKFTDLSGREYAVKPEELTHLRGRTLVPKSHPRIVLRGRLDSLQAKIIETQLLAYRLGNSKLACKLQDVLLFVRGLVRAEVKEEPVIRNDILGLTFDEIHERSHDPMKYYGYPHLMMDYGMGDAAIALNALRAEAREVEIEAYRAFAGDDGLVSRKDLVMALNRLSSCFYIMIFENLPAGYKAQSSGI